MLSTLVHACMCAWVYVVVSWNQQVVSYYKTKFHILFLLKGNSYPMVVYTCCAYLHTYKYAYASVWQLRHYEDDVTSDEKDVSVKNLNNIYCTGKCHKYLWLISYYIRKVCIFVCDITWNREIIAYTRFVILIYSEIKSEIKLALQHHQVLHNSSAPYLRLIITHFCSEEAQSGPVQQVN